MNSILRVLGVRDHLPVLAGAGKLRVLSLFLCSCRNIIPPLRFLKGTVYETLLI